jgi:transcriptional regulator
MRYPPSTFAEERPARLLEIVQTYPLATLIAGSGTRATACHIPLVVRESKDGNIILEGHVSAFNPIGGSDGIMPALAIFHGPQHYISPSWYPSKKNHPAVPTWDYIAVHAHGEVVFVRDRDWLRTHLSAISALMERNMPSPWSLDDLPESALESAIGTLTGIELRVTQLEGIFKLSQNKTSADRLGVRQALEEVGTPEAQAMAARIDVSGLGESKTDLLQARHDV